jgi:hypothetical protein
LSVEAKAKSYGTLSNGAFKLSFCYKNNIKTR